MTVSATVFGQNNIPVDNYVAGKVRIKFKEGSLPQQSNMRVSGQSDNDPHIGLQSVDAVTDRVRVSKMKRVFPFSSKHEAKHRKYGLHLWYELDFNEDENPENIVKAYEGIGEIELVKPVFKKINLGADAATKAFKTEALAATEDSVSFNDPLLPSQWHYENDGSIGGLADYDIDLAHAWSTTTGNSDVIVAIVDQGVDVNHEDLRQNIWVNEAELYGEEGVDDDGNGYVDDIYGVNFRIEGSSIFPEDHGTHVAGTVGAVSNNGIGVAGVAGGDGSGNGVKMMSTQVFDSRAPGGANFAEAIVYGADNGAVISQNSWGYNMPNYYEPEVLDAINYFIAEAGQYAGSPMKGGIVIFAAGNEGSEDIRYPGAFDEVIAVAATGPTGLPARYTNYGTWVDIAAPGGDMVNFGNDGGIISTLAYDNYGPMEGTSMACPHVSGVAALIVSKFGNEDFTNEDLKRILLNSVKRFDFDSEGKFGKGALNAERALQDDNRIPPNAITDLAAKEVFHNEVRLQWTVPSDEDGNTPAYYYLAVGENEITADNFESQGLYLVENNLDEGEKFVLQIGGFLKEKEYWFALKSEDYFQNLSDISNILKVTTTKEPHFMESDRHLSFTVDVKDNAVQSQNMQFSNIGDGIVYWQASILNEDYFWTPEPEEEVDESITVDFNAEIETNTAVFSKLETATTKEVTLADVESGDLDNKSHWDNDATEYIAGLSYDNGTPPAIFASTGDPNAGLIFATRFEVPYDYTFNLTHIEAVLYPEINDKPIIVEIKKGGRDSYFDAETVYEQPYYPDTTNVLKYYRIPLYKPQLINEDEVFWVVMHYPKEMQWPMVLQYGDWYSWNHFLFSRTNGRSYENSLVLASRPTVPMLNVLSTGNDGSYVFLNPNFGELQKGEEREIETTIDASYLTNGDHLASLGIYTNDIHKPVVNIEVKVEVTGQEPALDEEHVYEFNIHADVENELILPVTNTGLADLNITSVGLASGSGTITKLWEGDTLTIAPNAKEDLQMSFSTTELGVLERDIVLQTLEGYTFNLRTRLFSQEAPSIFVSTPSPTINVIYGETKEVELNISNPDGGSDLVYDLSHYNTIDHQSGILVQKFDYSVSVEERASEIEDWKVVKNFGKHFNYDSTFHPIKLDMQVPFFDQVLEGIKFSNRGELVNYINGELRALRLEDAWVETRDVYQHTFGDHSVFHFNCNVKRLQENGIRIISEVEYQIILFKDGTIEYRYIDVEEGMADFDYTVSLTGLSYEDVFYYRDEEDSVNTIMNGTVVTFTPDAGMSMVSMSDPKTGTVRVGADGVASVTLDPASRNMTAGTYQENIIVRSNTVEGETILPITVTVEGEGAVSIQDSVIFEDVYVGSTNTAYVKITNAGSDDITLTGFNSGLENVFIALEEFDEVTGLTITPLSNIMVPVLYDATDDQELNGTLSFNFDNGIETSIEYVAVKAKAQYDASYSLSLADDIHVSLSHDNTSETITFDLNNESENVALDYVFVNSLHAQVSSDTRAMEDTSYATYYDSYGYTYIVSDSSNNFHRWDDISEKGEMIQFEEGETITTSVLPFSLPFYEGSYDSVWVSSKGYVAVNETEEEIYWRFEAEDGISGIIAPFWTGIIPGEADKDGVYVYHEEDKVIFQWEGFTADPSLLGFIGLVTCQVEINANGDIYFHYKEVETWGGDLKIGIESPKEFDLVHDPNALIVRYAGITNGSSIALKAPARSEVEKGLSSALELTISAKNAYYTGTYKDTVALYTNSYAKPSQLIPVSFDYVGKAELKTPTEIVWEEETLLPNLVISKEIELVNTGSDDVTIDVIDNTGFGKFDIYNQNNGLKLVRLNGQLANPLTIAPWNTLVLRVEIPVDAIGMLEGEISFSGNTGENIVKVSANIVEPPVFSWDAEDQYFQMTNSDSATYEFTIENTGKTTLNYELKPAVFNVEAGEAEPQIIDEVGHYFVEEPIIANSIGLDTKEQPDGIFTPFIIVGRLAFSTRLTAPEGGITLTHVRVHTHLSALEQFVNIMIYFNENEILEDHNPQTGVKMYDQKYVIDQVVEQGWVNFPLQEPIFVPEGQVFSLITTQPGARRFVSFEINTDQEVLEDVWSGVNADENGIFYWGSVAGLRSMNTVYKIRGVTGSGGEPWFSVDQETGSVEAGESVMITTKIDGSKIPSGENKGILQVLTNDVNTPYDEISLNATVNGAPKFVFHPNLYQDTVRLQETEEQVFSYLFEDPEGENMVFSIADSVSTDSLKITYEQTSNTTAKLKVVTHYESEGKYAIPVKVEDEEGNMSIDSLVLKVSHKNRAPMLNPEYEVIYLNLAGNSSMTLDPNSLFEDPDGDEFFVYAGNYNPEIVDLTFGQSLMGLHAVSEGTAALVFAADDTLEDGYTLVVIFVVVINDPNAIDGTPSSVAAKEILENTPGQSVAFPNPVTDSDVNIAFHLEQEANVHMEFFDVTGKRQLIEDLGEVSSGHHIHRLSLPQLSSGMYYLNLKINGEIISSHKISLQ